MICKNCFTENPENSNFCHNCGAALKSGEQQNPNDGSAGYGTPYGANPYGAPPYSAQQPPKDEGYGFAVASLVCAIVSFFCCGIIAAPLAIIFAIVAKNKGSTSGMATAGLILGILAAAIMVLAFIFSVGSTANVATSPVNYHSFYFS